MPNSLRFSLPGNKDSISTTRMAISTYARSAGFSEEAIDDIAVSITEACKIICCHGYERRACRFIVVCGMKEDTINIKISNNNAEFTVDKEECTLCSHCSGDGDLSMFIVSSLMDSAELEDSLDGSKALIMEKMKIEQD